jgi:hypothetical protein
LVSLIFATACVIAAILLTRKKEPSHRGYPLNNWVKLLSHDNIQEFGVDCTEDNAPDAIRAIGTNALPFLVEWLKCEGGATPVQDAVYKCTQKLPVLQKIHGLEDWAIQDTKEVRSAGALVAFRVLGQSAAQAIPELFRMATKNPRNIWATPQHQAIEALVGIGEPALPALLSIATNKTVDFRVRSDAAESIGHLGTNAAPAISTLLNILEDDAEPVVGDCAAQALGEIGLEPNRVVPPLAKFARRTCATHEVILAIGRFGPNAVDAIPTLQQIADARDKYSSYTRRCALSTIAKIRTNSSPDSPSP